MTAAHKYYSGDFFISIFVQRSNRKCR